MDDRGERCFLGLDGLPVLLSKVYLAETGLLKLWGQYVRTDGLLPLFL